MNLGRRKWQRKENWLNQLLAYLNLAPPTSRHWFVSIWTFTHYANTATVPLRGLVETYGIVSISSQIRSGNRISRFNTPNARVYHWSHRIKTNCFVSISSHTQSGNRTSKFKTPNAGVYHWSLPIKTNCFVSISSHIQSGNRTSRFNTPSTRVCRLPHPVKTSCTVSLNNKLNQGT